MRYFFATFFGTIALAIFVLVAAGAFHKPPPSDDIEEQADAAGVDPDCYRKMFVSLKATGHDTAGAAQLCRWEADLKRRGVR